MNPSEKEFETALTQLAENGMKKFEITGGGEPFLNFDLNKIILKVREQVPDAYIKLYTNGSIHRAVSGINELNISTVHWDNEKITDVYQTKPERNLMDDLKYFYCPGKYSIRLSVPVFKGGIDSREKAEELIEKTKKYVEFYVFRPLLERTPMHDKFYVDFDISGANIEVDRDCSCFSKVLLWWTDNRFYSDWELKNEITCL